VCTSVVMGESDAVNRNIATNGAVVASNSSAGMGLHTSALKLNLTCCSYPTVV